MGKIKVGTSGEGLRERAEASLGRERTWLQSRFHDLLTQAAEANDTAGSLDRMLWRRSSVIGKESLVLLNLVPFLDDDDDDGGSINLSQL